MLVLKRKENETLVIDDHAEFTITRINGKSVTVKFSKWGVLVSEENHQLNEIITVMGNVKIHILHTSELSVKLGIDAPKNIHILRKELMNRGNA